MIGPSDPADPPAPDDLDGGTIEEGPSDLARLRRRLAEVEEQNLNATDALIGAEAAATQARRDIDEIFHRLHVREQELKRLKELLGYDLETPVDEVAQAIGGGTRNGRGAGGKRSVRAKHR